MKTEKEIENQVLVFYAYEQLMDSFRHYNNMQVKYRSYVFTWFFAMFFAIGYSLSSKEINLPLHPLLVVSFIVLATLIGTSLIWYQDLIVCERFIVSLVHQGKELEERHPWLPRIIHTSHELHPLMGYVSMKTWFYLGCYFLLFATLCVSVFYYFYIKEYSMVIWLSFVSFIGVSFGVFYLCVFSLKKSNPYRFLRKLRRKNHV